MTTAAPRPYRFNVDEYHQMGEAGLFADKPRVELIDGEVVEMVPIGSPHVASINRLNRLLVRRLQDQAIVSVQNPVRLSAYTEPQPDLALLKPRADDYQARLPLPDDVLLVIEVADSSAQVDRKFKAPLYAQAGIPELWIVDIPQQTLEAHTTPSDGGYSQVNYYRRGQSVAPATLPACAIPVDRILAP